MNRENKDKTKKSTRSVGARRRLRLICLPLLAFLAWAGFTLWEQTDVLSDKRSQLTHIEQRLAEVEQQHEQYQSEKQRLHDPEYIGQILRKVHQMSPDGETQFIKTR